jgi:hypothetical protein
LYATGFGRVNNEKIQGGILIMPGMYLLIPIAYFLAGLLPILFWNRRAKVDLNVYLLGWLSWFCAVSVKALIALFLYVNWPVLQTGAFKVINDALIETTEVISAFLFLKYHPALRDGRDWKSMVAFGLGFGCGEALTLGVTYLSLMPVPFSLELVGSAFLVGLERLSATAIHLSSACFLAFFLVNRKKSNFIMGLLSKDLSAAIAAVYGVVPLPLEPLASLALIQLIFVIYAVFWMAVLLYVRSREAIPEELPRQAIKTDGVNVLIPAVMFSLAFYLWSTMAPPLTLSLLFVIILSEIGFFFLVTIAVYGILGKIRGASATEVLVAGAISLTLCVGVRSIVMSAEPSPASLTVATLPFFGILCAAGVCKLLSKLLTRTRVKETGSSADGV